MKPDCILINAEPGETRIALIRQGRLMNLRIVRPDDGPRVGDVYLGRVEKNLSGIKAAFVDIGAERSGFLVPRDPVKEGEVVRVQVVREPYGDKGVKLTDKITSSPIAEPPAGTRPPLCLHRALEPVRRTLRDLAKETRVVVDDRLLLKELKEFCEEAAPHLTDWLDAHTGPGSIFDEYGITDQVEEALSPTLQLPSGGNIVISETAALTAIDVNTGTASTIPGQEEAAFVTNTQAATEIAWQIRLRNLAGLMVIDFVSMKNQRRRAKVLDILRDAVAGDPSEVHVAGYTRLGLVEMTRRRREASLSHVLTAPCTVCGGGGRTASAMSVALDALRRLRREADATPGVDYSVTAAPAVIDALKGPAAAAVGATERRLGRRIALTADETQPPDRADVGPAKERETP